MKTSIKQTQIINTAKDLFFRYGAKRVSVEEICKTAAVSKVTFYKHFRNKEALIRHIRDEIITDGFAKFDQISALDLPYPEKIDLMTRWRVEFFSQMKNDFLREMLALDEVVEAAKQRYLANITTAQAKGEIRPDLSPEFIWLITENLNAIARDGSWQEVFSDYSAFQTQMRTLFFYGLLVRPGDNTKTSGDQK
jgi:AcrR family transcriptional regulator